jgi:hypothetical protein
MLGMPVAGLPHAQPRAPATSQDGTIMGMPATGSEAYDPATARTVVGVAPPTAPLSTRSPGVASKPVTPPDASGRTMIGVAMPGIAPTHSTPEDAPNDDPRYEPAGELGATIAPRDAQAAWSAKAAPPRAERDKPIARDRAARPAQPVAKPARGRMIAVIASSAVLALGAVLFALLWPSAPPLTARVRVDTEGREVVELRCASCPDGTKIVAGGSPPAIVSGRVAEVVLPAPLTIGKNLLRVEVDRPGNGRDETIQAHLDVGYRIRPDLGTLQGERPVIQIHVEARDGTTVAIDGKQVPLSAGRAIETVDLTDTCTGLSDETVTFRRQIPYVITPPDAPPETGTVSLAVHVLPLRIEAPGAQAIIADKTFVLAGRTAKGAEVLAAGRPIPVQPDGSFAQTMNVSSVGATQIEVRAKMPGTAPRITKIGVRRVENLETAARELASASPPPVGYAAISADIAGHAGKSTILSGEVIETRRQGHQTVMVLTVSGKSGCADPSRPGACTVRLVQGADNPAKRGDTITAYGRVVRPFKVAGQPDVPEVQVDFTLKGAR